MWHAHCMLPAQTVHIPRTLKTTNQVDTESVTLIQLIRNVHKQRVTNNTQNCRMCSSTFGLSPLWKQWLPI